MRRFFLTVGTLLLGISLSGCATYFTRKACEKTNWYQHGYDVAMSGRRLDADGFIGQCQKASADVSYSDLDTGFKAGMSHYCQSDNVYIVGKSGKPFSYEMCDGESVKIMKARYEKGIREFCQVANGYHFGASGEMYLNVCPRDLEESWLKEYRRGRKVFLNAKVNEAQHKIDSLEAEISGLRAQIESLRLEEMRLAGRTSTKMEQIFDPVTGTYQQKVSEVPDAFAEQRRQQIEMNIFSINGDITNRESERDSLDRELSKIRMEMVTL